MFLCLWIDQPGADGPAHDPGHLVYPQGLHQLRPVGLDGFLAQVENFGDLAGQGLGETSDIDRCQTKDSRQPPRSLQIASVQGLAHLI